MIVYSASVLFYAGEGRWLSAYPVMATDRCYESVDGFMDYCELAARADPMFPVCNVFINVIICRVDEDGTVQREGVQPKPRSFRNYKA